MLLGDAEEGGVVGERGVGAAEAGVGGGVDALGGVVGDELGGGAAGVELDLVDGGDGLGSRVSKLGPETFICASKAGKK